jgi:hypothetical protein
MSSEAKFKLEILENLILCRHTQTMRHLKLVYHQSLEINGDWKFFLWKKKKKQTLAYASRFSERNGHTTT